VTAHRGKHDLNYHQKNGRHLMRKNTFIGFFSLAKLVCLGYVMLHIDSAIAANVNAHLQEPEDCVLEAIRAPNSKNENRDYIEKQCIKRFINMAKKSAKIVPLSSVSNEQISHGWILFDGNGFIVNLKNNSAKRLISIDVLMAKNEGGDSQIYKLNAEKIVEPYSFGKFSAPDPLIVNQKYFDDRYWRILSIYGIDE
jgi:hypothetical protein